MQVGPALAHVATGVLPLAAGVELHPHKTRANHDARKMPIAHYYHAGLSGTAHSESGEACEITGSDGLMPPAV